MPEKIRRSNYDPTYHGELPEDKLQDDRQESYHVPGVTVVEQNSKSLSPEMQEAIERAQHLVKKMIDGRY